MVIHTFFFFFTAHPLWSNRSDWIMYILGFRQIWMSLNTCSVFQIERIHSFPYISTRPAAIHFSRQFIIQTLLLPLSASPSPYSLEHETTLLPVSRLKFTNSYTGTILKIQKCKNSCNIIWTFLTENKFGLKIKARHHIHFHTTPMWFNFHSNPPYPAISVVVHTVTEPCRL